MNNKETLIERLRVLGLNRDEAKLYLELLREPNTHLRLAHLSGINRTKVYRLAENLEKRSLITKRSDDRGTFLVASDPATLEVALVNEEQKLKGQRQAFGTLLPALTQLKEGDRSSFIIQTYDGAEGLKQMLWHELRTKDEVLIFGNGTIEDLIGGDHRWAENHRAMALKMGYKVREILNPGTKKRDFTEHIAFIKKIYRKRLLPAVEVPLTHQIVIYNDTTAIYHWREEQKVGVEITDKDYAAMQRNIFEHYWRLAKERPTK